MPSELKIMKNLLFVLVLTSILLAGCRKDDSSRCGNSSSCLPAFRGYTVTAIDGWPYGAVDETDWLAEGTWTQEEEKLFAGIDLEGKNCSANQAPTIRPAYPNPTEGTFAFSTVEDSGTVVAVRLVNQDGNILATDEFEVGSGYNFMIEDKVRPRELIRLYYVFTTEEGCIYKGHGDIKIERE